MLVTLALRAKRDIKLSIATGRAPHHPSWQQRFAPLSNPLPEDVSSKIQDRLGQSHLRSRQCSVESVIGIIKEVLGFHQFSLHGEHTAGEWCLVCLAFNLKCFHTLI